MTDEEIKQLRAVAEEAAWELLNVDASMKDRAEVAEKAMRALGLPWPPPREGHAFESIGLCSRCGVAVEDTEDGEVCE